MADPTDVLQPNYMGTSLDNQGMDSLTKNYGHGVAEANPAAKAKLQEEAATPGKAKSDLRTAKAREFGKPKDQVGF